MDLSSALGWRMNREEFVTGLVVLVPRTGHEVCVEVSEPLKGT
ncbi:hypothetical protein ACFV24_34425 [Nocardia fluminea]